MAEGPDDLPKEIDDYVDRLVAPYFEAVAEWYGGIARRAEGRGHFRRSSTGSWVIRSLAYSSTRVIGSISTSG